MQGVVKMTAEHCHCHLAPPASGVRGHCMSVLAKPPCRHTAFMDVLQLLSLPAPLIVDEWLLPSTPALPSLCFWWTGCCCLLLLLSLHWHILQGTTFFSISSVCAQTMFALHMQSLQCVLLKGLQQADAWDQQLLSALASFLSCSPNAGLWHVMQCFAGGLSDLSQCPYPGSRQLTSSAHHIIVCCCVVQGAPASHSE